MKEGYNVLGGINTAAGQSGGPCREGSQTIIERRQRENVGRAEMYEWLSESMKSRPMTKLAEEQLWSLLVRERPY